MLGNKASERAELDALRGRVIGTVRRTCPAWLSEQAEDIAQAVLAQLVASLNKSEGKTTFSSIYIEKAVCGVTVDEIRRRCRRRESTVGEGESIEQAASPAANPERKAASRQIGLAVRDCLLGLVRPRRLAVTLYLEGCSVPETAQRLHWNAKRAENLVYRGLADLRSCLKRKGFEP